VNFKSDGDQQPVRPQALRSAGFDEAPVGPNRLTSYLPVASILAAGLCFSLLAFFYARSIEQDHFASQLNLVAAEPIDALERQINSDLDTVESLAEFFESSRLVEREEFRVFARSVLARHPNVQALEWLPYVKAAERPVFEREERTNGYSGFTITERSANGDLIAARQRESYFPVYYVEPQEGNEQALGFDVASEPLRRQALEKARNTGKLAATQVIELVQKPADNAGFLAMLPIFARQHSPAGPDQRHRKITGYVLGVFSVGKMIDAALSRLNTNRMFLKEVLKLHVYELAGEDDGSLAKNLIYFSQLPKDVPSESDEKPSDFRMEKTIDVADKQWLVVISAAEQFMGPPYTRLPWWVLFAALGTTIVVAMLYQARRRGTQRLKELAQSVNEKNAKLERVSTLLAAHIPSQVCKIIFEGDYDPSITAKRKILTIIFSDIVDFAELTSDLEPEDLTFLLNDYFTEMSAIAISHGATIDKFIGDAMLMFFGDPESNGREMDALAGVSMAVAMQEKMRDLRERWNKKGYSRSLHLRIGVNTGYANVGNFGSADRIEYTIIGNEVNKAARLQQSAEPDSIVLTGETYALVRDHFHAKLGAPLRLKGFAREIHPYYLLGKANGENADRLVVRIKNEALKVVVDLARIEATERERCLIQLEQVAKTIKDKVQ